MSADASPPAFPLADQVRPEARLPAFPAVEHVRTDRDQAHAIHLDHACFKGQGSHAEGDYHAIEEMEELAQATRFIRWIVDSLRLPSVGAVVEIGAGIGAVTEILREAVPHAAITALEPSATPFALLAGGSRADGAVIRQETSAAHLLTNAGTYDAVVHVNVLEHISDDAGELAAVRALLRPGGTLHLFVPALPRLYGPLDLKSGHYRRYRRRQLHDLLASAGYRDIRIRHFDLLGTLPYWLLSRAHKATIRSTDVTLFDRVWVPLARGVDRLFANRPPFGKNLVAVAQSGP